jgi:hypothetical protein
LNIEWFLGWKFKLNCSWNFRRNWNIPLVLLERSWWAGFNGIYLVRFGFRMREILIFRWFLPLKIQINSQKNQVLKGKINWERGNTWANTSVYYMLICMNCTSTTSALEHGLVDPTRRMEPFFPNGLTTFLCVLGPIIVLKA